MTILIAVAKNKIMLGDFIFIRFLFHNYIE